MTGPRRRASPAGTRGPLDATELDALHAWWRACNYLALTPKGRNETGPAFDLTDWVRHHDKYQQQPVAVSCCATKTDSQPR